MAGTSVALVLLTFVAFAPVLGSDFVYLDDPVNLLNNPDFLGVGWHQFAWSWRAHILGIYQPLGWQILSVQSALWGLDPRGYHLVSVLFHAANTVVFFLVTVELLARCRPDLPSGGLITGASLAASLFAVHPLRVEAVAWASCQTYLSCALFWLLAVLVYLQAHRGEGPRLWRLAGCWLLALAAMLCKATAVTLPIVLVILDFYPLRRLGGARGGTFGRVSRPVWLEKLPFIVLGMVLGSFSVWGRWCEYGPDVRGTGLSWRLAKASYGIAFYPMKTLLPVGLTPIRPTPSRVTLADTVYWPYAAFALGVTGAVILLGRRWPAGLAAWVSYLVVLAPNSGIFPLGRMIMVADRYSYVSTLGWFVLLGAGVAALRPRPLRRAVMTTGFALAVLMIPATWGQCLIWHDPESLWVSVADQLSAEVRSAPNSADAHYDLAVILNAAGRRAEAVQQIRSALSIDPSSSDSHCVLASILADRGRHEEALVEMAKAVRLDPVSYDARYGLAKILFSLGQLEAAEAEVSQALRLREHSSAAGNLLKRIREARSKRAEARARAGLRDRLLRSRNALEGMPGGHWLLADR